MWLMVDVPECLNTKLKIFRMENNIRNREAAVIFILEKTLKYRDEVIVEQNA